MMNLMQGYTLAKKYGHVVGEVIKLLEIVEASGEDKKLTTKERSQIMKQLWQVVYAIKGKI